MLRADPDWSVGKLESLPETIKGHRNSIGLINHSCSLNKALLNHYFSMGVPYMGVG